MSQRKFLKLKDELEALDKRMQEIDLKMQQ